MDHRATVTRIAAYITLAVMAACVLSYVVAGNEICLFVLSVSSWLHGICWGRLYTLQGRLTWF